MHSYIGAKTLFGWSTKDTSSNSILGSDYLTSAKLLVRHHYILPRYIHHSIR